MNSVPDPIRGYWYNGIVLPGISLDIVDYAQRPGLCDIEAGQVLG